MSEKDFNKKAFEQAEKELNDGKLELIKDFILENLKKDDEAKTQIAKLEEQRRIYKKNIEDARNGDFSKIEERVQKSQMAKTITPTWPQFTWTGTPNLNWHTSGTYTWCNSNGLTKTIYF